ncbi:MAG: hypothetical protein ABI383_09125 [Acidobacteriaceae bacterium]
MSAMSEGTNAMARALVDSLLGALGGGPLELVLAGISDDGTAGELGYAVAGPQVIRIDTAHGRRILPVAGERWELLIPADDLEQAASEAGFQDVYGLLGRCSEVTYAGVVLDVTELEAVCAGGEAYLYRLIAEEQE